MDLLPWVAGRHLFQTLLAGLRIERKLVQEEYGGLLFDNSASLVLLIAR
jgi:hypothetical protein